MASVCDCGSMGHNPAFCPQVKKDRELVKEGCGMAHLRLNMGGEFNVGTAQSVIRRCEREPCLCRKGDDA